MQDTLLNLIPGACSPEVHLSQYDKGRAIPFKLANGKSAYTVPEGAEIVVMATKPSGLGFVVPVTFDGDTATMTITETMSNEYGRFPAELSITSNGNRIGTANFVMNIERSPHPEGTIDGDAESLLPELTLLVERIEAAADSVDEDTQIVTEAKAEVLQAKADTLQAKADTLTARDESVSAKDLAVSSAQTSVEASQRAEELIGSVSTKADAIVKTASGEIASFTDGGDDLPMKSLKVNIVPKQSGSGDASPSNVRPISGTDTVNVNVFGVNAWDEEWELGIFNTTTGANSYSASNIRSKNYIPVVPNATYYFAVPSYVWTIFFDEDKNVIPNPLPESSADVYQIDGNSRGIGGIYTRTVTMPSNCHYIRFYCQVGYGNTYNNDISINLPSTVTDYEPYVEPISKSIPLGQTVYGGVLDVVSGKLSIDMKYDQMTYAWLSSLGSDYINITTSTWVGGNAVSIRNWNYADYPANVNGGIKAVCNAFPISMHNADIISSQYRTVLGIGSMTTVAEFLSAVQTLENNGYGLWIAHELKTPTEITLTPTQVKTLLGNNNIFADSGSVEVEYRADTTLAYNELVAMILENIGN